jgi:hypothetical protein
MNSELATNLLTARTAQTQHAVQLAVVKKSHEMQTDLLETLMQTALSAPPPGQGLRVDKQA